MSDRSRREFPDLPEAEQVSTPFGTMWIRHMFDSRNNTVRIGCNKVGTGVNLDPIIVNRVAMLVSLTLTDYGDGRGFVPRKDRHGLDSDALYARRADLTPVDVSPKAERKLRETLPGIVNGWASYRGGDFADITRTTLSRDIGNLQGRLEEAERTVEALKTEIAAKEADLAAV